MVYRDRTTLLAFGRGQAIYKHPDRGITLKESAPTLSARCIDYSRTWDGFLDITRKSMTSMGVSSKRNWRGILDESWVTEFKNFTPDYFKDGGPMSHLDDPNRPGNPDLAVQLVSRTNPSRPVANIPVALFELKDLPGLVRTIGTEAIRRIIRQRKLKDVAGANLAYQFGLKPMISDFVKLMNFKKSTEDRVKLLKKFQQGPLLRKTTLYTSVMTTTPGTIVTSNSAPSVFVIHHKLRRVVTTRKVWGYVKWIPLPGFLEQFPATREGDVALERRALQIVSGFTLDTLTLWEALPWSWLADWFSNTGDWLTSQRSLVPLYAEPPRICETITTNYEWECMDTSTAELITSGRFGTTTLTTKTRRITSAALPSAHLPALTIGQVNILSSLAALRVR